MKQSITAPKIIQMKPQNIPGSKPLLMGLLGDATYTPSGGSGGWQIVDRPKRVSATQWFDRSIWTLTLNCMISADINTTRSTLHAAGTENSSIEPSCLILESWMDRMQGSLEPPVFSVIGPIPGVQHYWVIASLEFGDALRNSISGFRYQQNVKLGLYEYQPPYGSKFNNIKQSHVDKYKYNVENGTNTIKLYQIGNGDTLRKIANKFHLGSDGVETLKSLNGIRDPRNIVTGQTIMIPGYK